MTATASDIRIALKKHFKHPEFGIVFEVAQGTGWKANRHLDAVAMGLWPSRGLHLHGVEIKVSRNDWRRELADPHKAEQIARFCDFFWLAAPEGVIPVLELPANWGLLELKGTKMVAIKGAEKLKPAPVTVDLMAAVFRASCRPAGADEVSAAIEAAKAELREQNEKTISDRVNSQVHSRVAKAERDAERWQALLTALDQHEWVSDKDILAAVKLVLAIGAANTHSGVGAVLRTLEQAATTVKNALALIVPVQAGGE